MVQRSIAVAALCSADALVLVVARPSVDAVAGHAAHPSAWVDRVGPDAALAAAAAAGIWLAAAWLALGLLAAPGAALPGVAGRAAETASRALLPGAVRRLLAGTAGLGVLLAPAVATAAPAPVPPSPPPVGSALPAPAWPVTTMQNPSGHRPVAAPPAAPAHRRIAGGHSSVPPPAWPLGSTGTPPEHPRGAATAAPVVSAGRPSGIPRSQPTGPALSPGAGPAATVRVRAGDSLWLIAARHLGPGASDVRIAAAWPRWYAANRGVIGDDPSLIRPGEQLRPPTAPPTPQARR